MALLARAFVIVAGFVAASLAASFVIVLAAIYPEWSDLHLGYIDRDWFGIAAVVGFVFVSGFALIPALIAIGLAEAFGIRALTYYAAAGAAAGALVIAGLGGFDPTRLPTDSFARRELELMIGAGIIGGLVYWLIAGRTAGNGRPPPPPTMPGASSAGVSSAAPSDGAPPPT